MDQSISCEEISTHNLKNISLEIPLRKITAVTGPSGAGKSSLVYDTLYAESYRRYVESLSSYARQYLSHIAKAQFKKIAHLPPSIALKQIRHASNPRSTLASLTELDDFLRAIFAKLSQAICPSCGTEVQKTEAHQVYNKLIQDQSFLNKKVAILSPLEALKSLEPLQLMQILTSQGFSRIWQPQLGFVNLGAQWQQNFPLSSSFVVIDRITLNEKELFRFEEAVRIAYKISRGSVSILCNSQLSHFSQNLKCLLCNISYPTPTIGLFSTDHPSGACTQCKGFGLDSELAVDKIVPDRSRSLAEKGLAAWNFGACRTWYTLAAESAKNMGINFAMPFSQYSKSDWDWLMTGDQEDFPGLIGFFAWLDTQSYKQHYRIHAAKFKTYKTCLACDGYGLNSLALAFYIDGLHFGHLMNLNLSNLNLWLQKLTARLKHDKTHEDHLVTLSDLAERLDIALQLGLDYLSLNRKTRTMSGGEFQRACLARCLASGLTDTLYCLDEPTTGLHPLDSIRLIKIIRRLRDLGNTVIMVEHDQSMIQNSDHIVCLGPKGGSKGGSIVYFGSPACAPDTDRQKERTFLPPPNPLSRKRGWLSLDNPRLHNLKLAQVRFPLHSLIGICGVSGSGKTSLVQGCLYHHLSSHKEAPEDNNLGILNRDRLSGELSFSTHLIDQKPLTRSSRSTVATILGLWDHIRDLLARTPAAKKLGLKKGSFSFNSPGGRCEVCEGKGWISQDLSFLGEVKQICEQCLGDRFSPSVLGIDYLNKNISEILGLTLEEASLFFQDMVEIKAKIAIARKLGLGYLTLGQTTSSLSGGEIQRLKLFSSLETAPGQNPHTHRIIILDEPSVGLADSDLLPIYETLKDLVEKEGCTIIMIEHNLFLLARCAWLVELGPGSAENGGKIIFQGYTQDASLDSKSITGRFLKDFFTTNPNLEAVKPIKN